MAYPTPPQNPPLSKREHTKRKETRGSCNSASTSLPSSLTIINLLTVSCSLSSSCLQALLKMISLRYFVLTYALFTLSAASTQDAYDPCCSFPCQNDGVCLSAANGSFTCDCTGLEYYGKTCETPYLMRRIKNMIRPSSETLHHLFTGVPWFWKIINNIPPLQKAAMRYVYLSRGASVDSPPRFSTGYDYITSDSHFNSSLYARSLPPVPKNCPTPMGVAGKPVLPDVNVLAERFFKRKEFIPEPHGTNVLFAFYAQHFSHQFFRTDKNKGAAFTEGKDGVDVSHIYGVDVATQHALRSFRQGKLKTQVINGEEYPPALKDAPEVYMIYPPHVPDSEKVALGHPFFSVLPGLFAMSTIWIREHNRICDILAREHADWDDERLYQTAKLIILGQNLKITIEEYVQHLSQYKLKLTYDPELLIGEKFQYSNRIHVEFNHLYHWHPLMPDSMEIANNNYTLHKMAFSTKPVTVHGLDEFVKAMATQQAGALSHHNHGSMVLEVFKRVVNQGRELRLQSFNNYRVKFGMSRLKSFEELTGETTMARELEALYGDIDALEFYPGMLLEKAGPSVTSLTMVNLGGPFAVKGMMANPISSPQYWKPSTFGGEVGFNIVKNANIHDLFCRNMKSCGHIAFYVPPSLTNSYSKGLMLESSKIAEESSKLYSPAAGTHCTSHPSLFDTIPSENHNWVRLASPPTEKDL